MIYLIINDKHDHNIQKASPLPQQDILGKDTFLAYIERSTGVQVCLMNWSERIAHLLPNSCPLPGFISRFVKDYNIHLLGLDEEHWCELEGYNPTLGVLYTATQTRILYKPFINIERLPYETLRQHIIEDIMGDPREERYNLGNIDVQKRLIADRNITGEHLELMLLTYADKYGVDLTGSQYLILCYPSRYTAYDNEYQGLDITFDDLIKAAMVGNWLNRESALSNNSIN
ncbi:hypothetical protein LX64_01918 [Chitinophaga skermanii]|uniref:Uncharacterized protein n=2 Tax=Chitinophaga skermanii TaxID=331697 RepID=A0A327QRB8_9BACT|nr:hypothetical protein LX64_01918 [Chitinophaga skermanii]